MGLALFVDVVGGVAISAVAAAGAGVLARAWVVRGWAVGGVVGDVAGAAAWVVARGAWAARVLAGLMLMSLSRVGRLGALVFAGAVVAGAVAMPGAVVGAGAAGVARG